MARQAYISMSALLWEKADAPEFEKLKTGYVGLNPAGEEYEIVSGVPQDAKLAMVIYVYESPSLPDVDLKDIFKHPSATVQSRRLTNA